MAADQFNKEKIKKELEARSEAERQRFRMSMELLFGPFYDQPLRRRGHKNRSWIN